jgi:hypothetical protein
MSFSSSTVTIGASTKKSNYDTLLANDIAIKNEAIDFYGTKTFQSGTVFQIKPKLDGIKTLSSTGSVSLEVAHSISTGTLSVIDLKPIVLNLGDWNMNTVNNIFIQNGGIDHTKVISITCVIRRDTDDRRYDFASDGSGLIYMDASNIGLSRSIGGIFDASAFQNTSFNRGFVTIWYED